MLNMLNAQYIHVHVHVHMHMHVCTAKLCKRTCTVEPLYSIKYQNETREVSIVVRCPLFRDVLYIRDSTVHV